jgi:hydrogenase maturation protease
MPGKDEPRILIVGLGNPLRSDDGLGWHAAQALTRQRLPGQIEIMTQQQLTPELSLSASQADLVVFIDAAQTGLPGEIRCDPVVPEFERAAFTHDLSPSAVLGLAEELYGTAPRSYLASLAGECFDHGEKLSESVIAALPQLVSQIAELATRMTGTVNPEEQSLPVDKVW